MTDPRLTFAADRGRLAFYAGGERVGEISGADPVAIAALLRELSAAMAEAGTDAEHDCTDFARESRAVHGKFRENAGNGGDRLIFKSARKI